MINIGQAGLAEFEQHLANMWPTPRASIRRLWGNVWATSELANIACSMGLHIISAARGDQFFGSTCSDDPYLFCPSLAPSQDAAIKHLHWNLRVSGARGAPQRGNGARRGAPILAATEQLAHRAQTTSAAALAEKLCAPMVTCSPEGCGGCGQ